MMRNSLTTLAAGAMAFTLGAGLAPAANAQEAAGAKDYVGINLGVANLVEDKASVVGGIEYRARPLLWKFYPHVGGFVSHRGAVYGYAGVGIDLPLTDWVLIRGNTAIGAYGQGDDRDLGSVVEFRSGLELVFTLPNESQIGVAFHHLSNAGLDDRNPGTEIATVSYSVPLDKLF